MTTSCSPIWLTGVVLTVLQCGATLLVWSRWLLVCRRFGPKVILHQVMHLRSSLSGKKHAGGSFLNTHWRPAGRTAATSAHKQLVDTPAAQKQNQLSAETQHLYCLVGGEKFLNSSEVVEANVSFEGNDFAMFCSSQQDRVCEDIISLGSWEPHFTRSIMLALSTAAQQRKLSAPGAGTFLDIGANVGWYSLVAAAAGYKVVGFEPVMNNERLQRSSICANPGFSNRIALHSVLLSNETSNSCKIFSLNDNKGNGIVKCDPKFNIPKSYTLLSSDAKVMMLDEFADSLKDVLLVKMDVEAHEPLVFQGGLKVFLTLQIPYIVTEWNWFAMNQKGSSDADLLGILRMFEAAGYALKVDGFDGATLTAVQVQEHATAGTNPHDLLVSIIGAGIGLFMVHHDVKGLI